MVTSTIDIDEQRDVGRVSLHEQGGPPPAPRSTVAGFWTIAGVSAMLLLVWWAILHSVDTGDLVRHQKELERREPVTPQKVQFRFGAARPFDRAATDGPGLPSADSRSMVATPSMARPTAGETMPGSRLDVEVRDFKHQTSLVLVGDLDAHTASQLEAALEDVDPSTTRVVLDMGGLEFIDSAGLGVIIRHDQQRDSGGLVLSNVNERVLKVMEYAGLVGHLTIE